MARKKVDSSSVTEALHEGPQSNKDLRDKLGLPTSKGDSRLDRQLQDLRKEGKIHLVGGRWALSTVEPCPTCAGRGWVNKTQ